MLDIQDQTPPHPEACGAKHAFKPVPETKVELEAAGTELMAAKEPNVVTCVNVLRRITSVELQFVKCAANTAANVKVLTSHPKVPMPRAKLGGALRDS